VASMAATRFCGSMTRVFEKRYFAHDFEDGFDRRDQYATIVRPKRAQAIPHNPNSRRP
jgi:hypothetical protein